MQIQTNSEIQITTATDTESESISGSIRDTLVVDFLDESMVLLNDVSQYFTQLAQAPRDIDLMFAVYRPLHSIKSSSSFLGLINVKFLCHKIETILDLIRQNRLQITPELLSLFLKGIEMVRSAFVRIKNKEEEVGKNEQSDWSEFIEKLTCEIKNAAPWPEELWLKIFKLLRDFSTIIGHDSKFDILKFPFQELKECIDILAPKGISWIGRKDLPVVAVELKKILLTDRHALKKLNEQDVLKNICSLIQSLERELLPEQQKKGTTILQEMHESLEAIYGVAGLDDSLLTILDKKLNQLVDKNLLRPEEQILSTSIPPSSLVVPPNVTPIIRTIASNPNSNSSSPANPATPASPGNPNNPHKPGNPNYPRKVPGKDTAKIDKNTTDSNKVIDASIVSTVHEENVSLSGQEHTERTLTITESQLDAFLNYVGKLIIVTDVYRFLEDSLRKEKVNKEIIDQIHQANKTFQILSENLQESIMNVCKVPLNSLFQTISLAVNEICSLEKKIIELEFKGKEVQIDKSIVDSLQDSILHIVRNTASKGIESIAERTTLGKKPKGQIKIVAHESEESISLLIQDDGRGIDAKKILARAINMGLVSADTNLNEDEKLELMFKSGFSSMNNLTDNSDNLTPVSSSGGVEMGMDTIFQNLNTLNAKTKVETEIGKGSTFTVTLPKNVSAHIIDGMLVKLFNENYLIPLPQVKEILNIKKSDIHRNRSGKNRFIVREQKLYSVINVREKLLFSKRQISLGNRVTTKRVSNATGDSYEIVIMIIVELATREQVALQVDEIIGQKKMVVQKINFGANLDTESIKGAGNLGNGEIALLLNLERICVR
ncbi:MAG: chemotaxis protein CheW [Oligoflexia bacterium]|nr:chemotaxis protein CheW [Oligoflexia bacterium]